MRRSVAALPDVVAPNAHFGPRLRSQISRMCLLLVGGAGISEAAPRFLDDSFDYYFDNFREDFGHIAVTALVTVALVGGGFRVDKKQSRHHIIDSIQNIIEFRAATGESVEVITQKDGSRMLVWNGSLESSPIGLRSYEEKCEFIAELAKQSGCSKIAVKDGVLPDIDLGDFEWLKAQTIVDRSKGVLRDSVQSNEFEYAVFEDSTALLQTVNSKEDNTKEHSGVVGNNLQTCIAILEKIDPNNALIRTYNELASAGMNDAEILLQLKPYARSLLSSGIGSSERTKIGGVPQRVDKAGYVLGESVALLSGNGEFTRQSLYGYFGIKKRDSFDYKGLSVAEKNGWMQLILIAIVSDNWKLLPNMDQGGVHYEPYTNCTTLTEISNQKTLSKKQRRQLIGRGALFCDAHKNKGNKIVRIALGGIAVVTAFFAFQHLNEYASDQYDFHYPAIEKSLKANNPGFSTQQPGAESIILQRLWEENPLAALRSSKWDADIEIDKWWEGLWSGTSATDLPKYGVDSGVSQTPMKYSIDSRIQPGDVNLPANSALWSIEAPAGVNTSGFWALSTYPNTDANGTFFAAQETAVVGDLPTEPLDSVSSIKIVSTAAIEVGTSLNPNYSLRLPVLNGYKVVAANVNGNPITINVIDGLQNVVTADTSLYGPITYWLAPSNEPLVGEVNQISNISQEDLIAARGIWQQFRGARKGTINSDAYLFKNTIKYSLQPDKGFSIDDYLNNPATKNFGLMPMHTQWTLIDKKEAVCNTAAAALNGIYFHKLVYTEGLNNRAAGPQSNPNILSANEGHAVNTMQKGNKTVVVDATPGQQADPSDHNLAKFSEESLTGETKGKSNSFNIVLGGLAFFCSLSITKRSVRFGAKAKGKLIERRVKNIDQSTINTVYNAINAMLYSPEHQTSAGSNNIGNYTVSDLQPYANDAFIDKVSQQLKDNPGLAKTIIKTLKKIQKSHEQRGAIH